MSPVGDLSCARLRGSAQLQNCECADYALINGLRLGFGRAPVGHASPAPAAAAVIACRLESPRTFSLSDSLS